MEYNFFDVRIGTRTRAGNLNVLHSFVCKSYEKNKYKIFEYYTKRYVGLEVDVIEIKEVFDISNENIKSDDFFENTESNESTKIKELEREIKTLKGAKNSTFSMEINCDRINESNRLLYNQMKKEFSVYIASVEELEKGIKNEIMEMYKPFASSVSTIERMNGNNAAMRFNLNLKAKLF